MHGHKHYLIFLLRSNSDFLSTTMSENINCDLLIYLIIKKLFNNEEEVCITRLYIIIYVKINSLNQCVVGAICTCKCSNKNIIRITVSNAYSRIKFV